MEQGKWIMVRQETKSEKFKRKLKTFFIHLFGLEEYDDTAKQTKKTNKKKNNKIVIEIIS